MTTTLAEPPDAIRNLAVDPAGPWTMPQAALLQQLQTSADGLTSTEAAGRLAKTGWFVEALVTQTLVIFIIRTAGNPLRSRPSLPLTATTLVIVLCAFILPYTPIAAILGF